MEKLIPKEISLEDLLDSTTIKFLFEDEKIYAERNKEEYKKALEIGVESYNDFKKFREGQRNIFLYISSYPFVAIETFNETKDIKYLRLSIDFLMDLANQQYFNDESIYNTKVKKQLYPYLADFLRVDLYIVAGRLASLINNKKMTKQAYEKAHIKLNEMWERGFLSAIVFPAYDPTKSCPNMAKRIRWCVEAGVKFPEDKEKLKRYKQDRKNKSLTIEEYEKEFV